MTCIVALKEGKTISMGADSITCSSHSGQVISRDEKFFQHHWGNEKILLGTAGSIAMRQALRYRLVLPAFNQRRCSPEEYLATYFLDVVGHCFKLGLLDDGQRGGYSSDFTESCSTWTIRMIIWGCLLIPILPLGSATKWHSAHSTQLPMWG